MYKCVVPLTLFTSKVLEYFYSFCYFGALLFNKTFFYQDECFICLAFFDIWAI